jgi:hypothetical protein
LTLVVLGLLLNGIRNGVGKPKSKGPTSKSKTHYQMQTSVVVQIRSRHNSGARMNHHYESLDVRKQYHLHKLLGWERLFLKEEA